MIEWTAIINLIMTVAAIFFWRSYFGLFYPIPALLSVVVAAAFAVKVAAWSAIW